MINFVLAAVWAVVGLGVLLLNSRNDFSMKNRINSLRFNYVILLYTLITILIADGVKHL